MDELPPTNGKPKPEKTRKRNRGARGRKTGRDAPEVTVDHAEGTTPTGQKSAVYGATGDILDEYPLKSKTAERRLLEAAGRDPRYKITNEHRQYILNRQLTVAVNPNSSNRDSIRSARYILDCDKFNEGMSDGNQINTQVNTQVTVNIPDNGRGDTIPPP